MAEDESPWRRTGLTAAQEQAVSRRAEPLLLAAGAGAGKTAVLVERFVRAVLEDGLAPARVLAITFTDRAAGELRERVRKRFLELGQREAARDTEAAFVGTFHSFCARLLRAHALLADLDPDFAVLEEGVASRLRERAFAAAALDFQSRRGGEAVDLLAAYGIDQVAAMVQGVHAELRSRGQRHPRLPAARIDPSRPDDAVAARACALLNDLLGAFDAAYEQAKRTRAAVDFDDLELGAVELLARAPLRTAWAERFGLLMVDEFQDTNPRQLAILRALDRGNLFTVGDELQSIYGFRHADVELFRARRRELEAHGGSLALRGNFRSHGAILAAVNAAFTARVGTTYEPLVSVREEVAGARPPEDVRDRLPADASPRVELLLTARGGWEEDPTLAARLGAGLPPAAPWRAAEARLLAQRVADLVHGGEAAPGEVAVLLRATADVSVFERALQLHGLRTLAVVGGFWGRLEVRDALAYLRVLANPLDEAALYQVLASPLVGLSSDALALVARAARANGASAWQAACEGSLQRIAAGEHGRLDAFCRLVRDERARLRELPLAALLERMLAAGYGEYVRSLADAQRRLANLHKLLRLARRFEAGEGRDLRAFLEHVAGLEVGAAAPEPEAPAHGVQADAVRLMTVHAAKGLEFDVVCVADLGRASNNRSARLLVDGDRVGLQLVRLDGEKAQPCLDYERLCEQRRRAQEEEEDRILYVAMTRARERLLLSGAIELSRWGGANAPETTPMGWLAPALAEGLAELPAASCTVELPGGAIALAVNSPATIGAVLRLDAPVALDERHAAPTPSLAPPPLASTPEAVEVATLSYSSLTQLERCGYRYYLERVLGMPEAPPPVALAEGGIDPRIRGRIVHAVLEGAALTRAQAPTEAEVAGAAREAGARLPREQRAQLASLLERAWRAPFRRRLASLQHVRRELPFAFALAADAPLVTGVIDLLAVEGDGAVLVLDYKSDRVQPDVDLAALVEDDYGLQRMLYALAVLRDGAARVHVVHWFLERPAEPVEASYGPADRAELQTRLAARARHALASGFAVSASPHRALCLTCPGRGSLCSWGSQETLRERPAAALRLPFA